MGKNFSKLFLLLEIKHTSCIYYTMILTEIKILCYRRRVKMIRKIIRIDKEKLMDAVPVQMPVMKVPLTSLTEKQNW